MLCYYLISYFIAFWRYYRAICCAGKLEELDPIMITQNVIFDVEKCNALISIYSCKLWESFLALWGHQGHAVWRRKAVSPKGKAYILSVEANYQSFAMTSG